MLTASGLASLRQRAQQDIEEGVIPACQYAVAREGEVLAFETLGEADASDRFAIWSSTKPIFAAVVWMLFGEGLIRPKDRVVDYWPEFGAHGKSSVTIEHLLLFTAGFPDATLDLTSIGDRQARVAQMQEWTLAWEPGTSFAYHGLSAHWVMAEIVARVTGQTHTEALRHRVLDPLGLDRLELGVSRDSEHLPLPLASGGTPASADEVAEALGLPSVPPNVLELINAGLTTGASPTADLDSLLQPQVLEVGVPGGGCVSDAASVTLFYQALLHNPDEVWDPAVLADATGTIRNTFAGAPLGVIANRTLGLEVQGSDPTARFRSGAGVCSPRTFGHPGALGQVAWADPESGLSFCYLTNGHDLNLVRQARRGRQLTQAVVDSLL